MKLRVSRTLRALCIPIISTLAAACGDDSGTAPAVNDQPCCFAYPDPIVLPAVLVGPDPLLYDQWHLQNSGQAGGTPGEDLNVAGPAGAWSLGTDGLGVRVAIVDDAIEVVHPDLAPNFSAANGVFFNYRAGAAPGSLPLPYYFEDDHGTAVAGIVLARNLNAIGGAGVAPRAEMAAYNPLSTSLDADIADALLRDNASTSVYNNSWGSPDNGALNVAEASFVSAIETGIAAGRGGKGSIYVFPAGNGGCYMLQADGSCAGENANYDGYVNQRGVIAACAVDDNGRAPVYAEPGANILVCGRSGNERAGITTTDPQGAYRSDFNGTSASTPTVSGVAALMLQSNPALTWRDVRLIMAKSARKNHPTDPGWVSYAGLKDFNPKYGFGAVDAAAAVTLAQTWASVGGSAGLTQCSVQRGPNTNSFPKTLPPQNDPDPTRAIADAIDLSGCGITKIEFVEVRFTATHTYSGDLAVSLRSPNGLESTLAGARLCDRDRDGFADDCGSYTDWAFGSVRHLDESAAGVWRLHVSDGSPDGDTGTWDAWRLTIWGR